MRILGIDPGIGRMGWGVIEAKNGKLLSLAYDCFETKSTEEVPQRLAKIFAFVTNLFETHKPDALAIEELFFNTNAKTAFVVGQARGVVLLVSAQQNVPVTIYTPLQVKMSVTGYGRAEKKQVEKMVTMLLKLEKLPKHDDTFDALAIAITHSFSHKLFRLSSG